MGIIQQPVDQNTTKFTLPGAQCFISILPIPPSPQKKCLCVNGILFSQASICYSTLQQSRCNLSRVQFFFFCSNSIQIVFFLIPTPTPLATFPEEDLERNLQERFTGLAVNCLFFCFTHLRFPLR